MISASVIIIQEYVWFVDADDWLAYDALEKMHNKAKEANYDVVSSDFYEGSMDTNKRLLYITNGTAGFTKMIKREYLC